MSQNMTSPVLSPSFTAPERSIGPTPGASRLAIVHASLSNADLDRVIIAALGKTQAQVDTMTVNDKQYALQVGVAAGTITIADLMPPLVQDAASPVAQIHPYGTVWINTTTQQVYQTDGEGTWLELVDLA